MVLIILPGKCHHESSVCNGFHLFGREPFSRRYVTRATFDDAGKAHETLISILRLRGFQLLADQLTYGYPGTLRGVLKPV